MDYMSERESLMYQAMGAFADAGMPLVFKGGLITKVYLIENGLFDLTRGTVDIDATWINNQSEPDYIVKCIDSIVKTMNTDYSAEVFRTYNGMNTTVGIAVKDHDVELFKMDLELYKPVANITQLTVQGKTFNCVDVKQIIADKLVVVSKPIVFRRAKDILDLYGLTKCVVTEKKEILKIINESGRALDDFNCFIDRKDDLNHAYDRLKGVVKKPSFGVVYK